MRQFAELWPDETIWQQPVAKLPWGHQITLMEKLETPSERLWYAAQAVEHGWSRNVLALQIGSNVIARQGKAPTNFKQTLPAPSSDLAESLLKDPYAFDFLTLSKDAKERELELGLIAHMREFLVELGAGFAFLGRQYHLEVGGDDFYTDLLFYHVKLHCYVIIDLKMGKFEPEFAGKMNFYVSAIDSKLRDQEKDGPTIGLILCRSKNHQVVEYALGGTVKPIGVATFNLPVAMKEALAVDEIKHHFAALDVDAPSSDEARYKRLHSIAECHR